jgi:hypothetical protein
VFISFNEITWWVFDKATIAGVCVPIMCKKTVKTCKEESETCFASGGRCCGGKTPSTIACRWLAGWAAPPVVREKSAAARGEQKTKKPIKQKKITKKIKP